MYFSNINRTGNCWNWFAIEYAVWDVLCIIVSCHSFSGNQQLEALESRN